MSRVINCVATGCTGIMYLITGYECFRGMYRCAKCGVIHFGSEK